jgi:RNA polymerase sigma-70 factor (ECF subfamily)
MREATLAMVLPATRVQSTGSASDTYSLISRAREGDMNAFDLLMRQHERLVLMTALRFLRGNMADAQDAGQTVFLRLHRALGQFREAHSAAGFEAWLYRITVNVCHDMNRKTRRRGEVGLETVSRVSAAAPQMDTATDEARQRKAIAAGLEQLGEKERAAIVLRDIEGLETREVASILGSSEATVRSQISVGRRKIRDFAKEYMRRKP